VKNNQQGRVTIGTEQVLEQTLDHKLTVHRQRTVCNSPMLCSIFTWVYVQEKVKRIGTSLVEGAVNDFSF